MEVVNVTHSNNWQCNFLTLRCNSEGHKLHSCSFLF